MHFLKKFGIFVWYTITSQEDIRILSNYKFFDLVQRSKEDKQQSMSSLYPVASASI